MEAVGVATGADEDGTNDSTSAEITRSRNPEPGIWDMGIERSAARCLARGEANRRPVDADGEGGGAGDEEDRVVGVALGAGSSVEAWGGTGSSISGISTSLGSVPGSAITAMVAPTGIGPSSLVF